MKILLSWLREFVDVPGTAEEIARTMSVRGFAVEGIEQLASVERPGGAAAIEDWVIDFEVTANRPDCMSVLGMAREVAAAYRLPIRSAAPVSSRLRQVDRGDITVTIEDAALCPRYAGAVADVTIGPSPVWMQARLAAAGVRPISNIVDVTNYVLLELGQPMHAFDLTRLAGAEIRVRTARPGETLRTLDGQARTLTPDMLVIADAREAVAVAGVMGGADSEVGGRTSAIVFESACFNALSVRRTSRALGLKTEASVRFERGADPELPFQAMERACALIEDIGAGRARGTAIDCYPSPVARRILRLRQARINAFLGVSIPDDEARTLLGALGFELREVESGWDVSVPARRVDVHREVDLIEEVARHWGFDKLPASFPPLGAPAPPVDPRITRARQIRTVMAAHGFSEAVTFGFIAEAAAAPFAADGELVPIANPLSETYAVLRPSALPGILDAVAHNRRREQHDVRLFEVGARFTRAAGEQRTLSCAWTGAGTEGHWSGAARAVDFFDLKGLVERIAELLRIQVDTEPAVVPWLVNGRSAAVAGSGGRLGVMGQLAPAIAEQHGLPASDPVFVLELDLDAAERLRPSAEPRVDPLPRYPSVTRDLSILLDDRIAAASVRRTILDAAPPTLVRVSEFDRYQGKGIPGGKISLSLRLTFRSPDRTLTDAEVHQAMGGITTALTKQHSAIQR